MGTVPLLTDEQMSRMSDAELLAYADTLKADLEAWEYQPVQLRAEDASKTAHEILYGGAAGGGKSDWLLHHAHDLSLRVPGHRSLLLRRTFPELRRSLITRSILRFAGGPCRYLKSEQQWQYTNGSVIEFGHCQQEEDVKSYLSAEYDFIGLDEGGEFTQWQIEMLASRCRTTIVMRARGSRPHIALATNPGGPGHGYLRKRFIIGTDRGAKMYETPEGRTVAFVPAKLTDNAYIDPSYAKWLMGLPEIERRQYLFGDWDVFAGQYFGEFQADLHVVEPFEIDPSWQRGRGLDWGWRDPFACLWGAWDPDGNAYIYREFEQAKLTPEQQARTVLALSGDERFVGNPADPSVFGRHNGIERPISEKWSACGLVPTRAANARVPGWTNVREYLKPDDEGRPSLYIFKTCPRLIETLPELEHDRKVVEDAAKGDDHLPDALRYLLMLRPRRRAKEKPKGPTTMTERVWAHLERKRREREGNRRVMNPQSVV